MTNPIGLGALSGAFSVNGQGRLDSSKLCNLYDYPIAIRECRWTVYGPLATMNPLTINPPVPLYSTQLYVSMGLSGHNMTWSPLKQPVNAVPLRLLSTEIPNLGQENLVAFSGSFSARAASQTGPVGYNFGRWVFDYPLIVDPGDGFDVSIMRDSVNTQANTNNNLQVEMAFVGESLDKLPKGQEYPLIVPYACAFVGSAFSAVGAVQNSGQLELANRINLPVTITSITGFLTDTGQAPYTDFTDFNTQQDQSLVVANLVSPDGFQIAKNCPWGMLFDNNRRAFKTNTVVQPRQRFSLNVQNSGTRATSQVPQACILGYRQEA